MIFPYTTIANVQKRFKNLEQFDSRERIADWTKTDGQTNVYQYPFSGYVGIVYEDGIAYTEQTSIANVDSNAGSFYYDSSANITYIHTTGSDATTAYEIALGIDEWDDFLTEKMNEAFMDAESFVDSKFPRPLPMARDQYNDFYYDSGFIEAIEYITASKVIQIRDLDNPLWMKYWMHAIGTDEEPGILLQYKNGDRSFSFETTADEFDGNIKQLVKGTDSTGMIQLAGSGDRSNREMIHIKITTAGAVGVAKFSYSTDNEVTYSDSIFCTINYVYLLDGIYLKFSGTFVENDKWLIELIGGQEEITNPKLRVIKLYN